MIMYIKIHVHVWLCLQLLFQEIIVKIIMIPEVNGVYNSIGTFDVHVSYNMYIQIHIHVWSCL